MESNFKVTMTLSGQTTTIELDRDDLEMGEVALALYMLLLGSGFQPETIEDYLDINYKP